MTAFPAAASLRKPLTPAAKGRLAWEVLRAYVRVRRQLRRHDLRATVAILKAAPGPSDGGALDELAARATCLRLAHAVGRTLSVLPTDNRCLLRSLVLTDLLSRSGIASTLVLGVRTDPDFAAHAWVERAGEALLPAGSSVYQRLLEL